MARLNELEMMKLEVLRWIQPLIPDENRDIVRTTIKLQEEACELMDSLYIGGKNTAEEIADIMVCLLDIAHLTGTDIYAEVMKKMNVNRERNWYMKDGRMTRDK